MAGEPYYLYRGKAAWADAQSICRARGLELATVFSASLATSLHTKVANATASADHYWLGAFYSSGGAQQAWQWADGSPWSFASWAQSQPNSTISGACLGVLTGKTSASTSGQWGGFDCGTAAPFICSAPGELTPCQKLFFGYVLQSASCPRTNITACTKLTTCNDPLDCRHWHCRI